MLPAVEQVTERRMYCHANRQLKGMTSNMITPCYVWAAGIPNEPVTLTPGAVFFIGQAFAQWLKVRQLVMLRCVYFACSRWFLW
jgi:hypothetical protein